MDIFPDVKVEPPLPHERVLRLAVTRLRAGYKPGWLYFKCKEQGLLDIFNRYQESGYFDVLERGSKDQTQPTRLTIELVPRSSWFENVRNNVSKEEWQFLKRATSQKANLRCQVCGGKGSQWPVECHEVWHYDDEQHVQSLRDLVALCPSCHEVKHIGLTQLRGKGVEATAHLAIVNGWSYGAAEKCIEEAFETWKVRSTKTWTLDISWLERQGIPVNKPKELKLESVTHNVIEERSVSPENESIVFDSTGAKQSKRKLNMWQKLICIFAR